MAGVVVHIERDAAVLLTHSGPADRPELRHCRLADLSRRLNPVRHSAQDVNMAPLGRGDSVHVTDGPLAGKSGVVQWVLEKKPLGVFDFVAAGMVVLASFMHQTKGWGSGTATDKPAAGAQVKGSGKVKPE